MPEQGGIPPQFPKHPDQPWKKWYKAHPRATPVIRRHVLVYDDGRNGHAPTDAPAIIFEG